ncbi:hypothetical protein [Desulforamulus ferrireducens]|uniref:Uncharacterized protein n=1 Tax=Desulforamulus ferrireducens TaxID=1833852 RepID=A0A1S6ITA7_9FIRM|nr:hypothetical protein [Desulforamulus ferrireducens]AQS58000.1 hypothetical protein B0537_02130 [Desulforamulus ferrireducens]
MGTVIPMTSNPRYISNIPDAQEYILQKLNSRNRVGLPLSSSGIDFSDTISTDNMIPAEIIQLMQRIIKESISEALSSISTSWTNPSLAPLEQGRLVDMGLNLSREAEYFIRKLQNVDTKRILVFDNNGIINIWAIVQYADIDLEMKYSELLLETMEVFPNTDLEFMVFDEEEICKIPIPKEAKTIFAKEGD